ncbi:class I SAM-dependent methyltransferase [Actinoplanes sp. NPDC051494]|uniref:class I SAM-dependent methyltransferase n=1 Tax=Actinoplanes sp. NPDC051494 TaxID=3363907 RepID=UPI0037B0F4FF
MDIAGLTEQQRERWTTVLDHLAGALPERCRTVLVEAAGSRSGLVAERLLAERLAVRLEHRSQVLVVTGRDRVPAGGAAFTVWVRTPAGNGEYRGDDAQAVVDLHDITWPVLRHLDPVLAGPDRWYRTESRAFFAARAATWDTKFGDDLPAYAAAIAEAGLASGGVAVDVGCGTGRALPALRAALGPAATVVGVDHTPQMLAAAAARARACDAVLLLADARNLPLADRTADAVFAAGLIQHLPDHEVGLAELARITRPGGRLLIFHPSGRAALAARHGRRLRPDEPLAESVLRASAGRTGWHLTTYDDQDHRFFAVAVRVPC